MNTQTPAAVAARSRFALAEPIYRRFWIGALFGRVGDWMDQIALNWSILQLTGSPVHLAWINACRLLPVFAVSLPAGVLADRWERRRLLQGVQVWTIVLTLVLAVMMARQAPFPVLAAVVALRAIVAAMEAPARQALIPATVSREGLSSALALYTTGQSLARIIGPALAGWGLTLVSAPTIFVVSAGLTTVAWATLWRTPLVNAAPPQPKGGVSDDIAEAWTYIRQTPDVQSLMLLAVVPMIFGFPYTAMMPVFAQNLFHLGPDGFGILLSAAAVGAVIGSGRLAFGGTADRIGRRLMLSICLFGSALLLLMQTRWMGFAVLVMVLVGGAGQSYRTLSRISLQERVPDHLRGRIMSIALMDRGMIPLGAMLIGWVAAVSGAWWAGMTMGLGCLVICLLVGTWRRSIWEL